MVAAVCPRPKGGKALAENPLRRGQPAANQLGESGCRPYGGKPTRRGRLGRLINFRYRSKAPAKPSKIFTSIYAHFVACRSLRGPDPANLLKNPPVKVTFSAADHRGGGAGSVAVALPFTNPKHGACARGPHFRRPPALKCRLRGDFCVCGCLIFLLIGGLGGVSAPFAGRCVWGVLFFFAFLSGVLFFFVSLSLVFRSFPCWHPPSPRPLPWCRLSAFPPCFPGSPCVSSVCRPRPAFPSRSGSPQRVHVSLRGCAVGSVARGRSVGRWLACALRGSVCRCCRAGLPPLVSSCLCFLNFF